MRYVSVFSGVEAATVAWEPLGWEPVAFCEIDAFPSAVLAERFPDVPNLGDITKVYWEEFKRDFGTVDLVVGGSPCQSFSVAGKREGLSGASGLMWEYVRAVRELRPRWFVWENVPGALSSEGGEAFRCLLASMDELGYQCCWRVLDAQFFGVAQRRRRVFLVGSLGSGRAADVLFEPDCLRWDTPSSRDKRKALAARAEGGTGGSRTLQVRCGCAGGGKGALIQEDVSATLSCSNVQTLFQPAYGFSAGQGAKAGGIAFQEEQSPTLKAGASGTNQVPSMLQPTYGFSWHMGAKAGNIGCESEQSPTLTNGGKPPAVAFAANHRGEVRLQGGDGDVFGALPCSNVQTLFQPTYCIQETVANGKRMGQNGSGFSDDDVSYTLDTMDTHAVAFAANQRGEVRLQGGDGDVFGALPCSWSAKQVQAVVCIADDNGRSAVDADLCGTLKCGGGSSVRSVLSNGEDFVGTLAARDYKGVGSQYVNEGKVVVQWSDPVT